MTSHETVNRRYSDLQTQLRLVFAAEGRGLSEMVRTVETQIPPTLSWELRAIAHIRNKVVHEGLAEIPRYFEPLCKEALTTLKRLKAEKKKANQKRAKIAVARPAIAKPAAARPVVAKAAVAKKRQMSAATKNPAHIKSATKKPVTTKRGALALVPKRRKAS